MYPAGLPMQIMRKHDAEKNGIRGILSRNVQKSTDIEKGKLTVSRRYNLLPLLPSGPDGVQRELSVRDLPFGGSPTPVLTPCSVAIYFSSRKRRCSRKLRY